MRVPRCSWGLDRTSAGARGAGVSWQLPSDPLILLPLQRQRGKRSGAAAQGRKLFRCRQRGPVAVARFWWQGRVVTAVALVREHEQAALAGVCAPR